MATSSEKPPEGVDAATREAGPAPGPPLLASQVWPLVVDTLKSLAELRSPRLSFERVRVESPTLEATWIRYVFRVEGPVKVSAFVDNPEQHSPGEWACFCTAVREGGSADLWVDLPSGIGGVIMRTDGTSVTFCADAAGFYLDDDCNLDEEAMGDGDVTFSLARSACLEAFAALAAIVATGHH